MATNAKPVYKRILLKLSGEALQGTEGFGIDASILDRMAQETKELIELSIQVDMVIGGGNLFCGTGLAKAGVNRVVDNHVGMLTTVINGLAMRSVLHRAYINARLISAVPLNGACDSYGWVEATSLLRDNRVAILFAGTGNSFSTTDSAICLHGTEIGTDAVLKATKVDGVLTADPVKDPTATMCERPTYSEASEKELRAMGLAAFTLARDHKLSTRVFNMSRPGALCRVVMGEKEGTLITE